MKVSCLTAAKLHNWSLLGGFDMDITFHFLQMRLFGLIKELIFLPEVVSRVSGCLLGAVVTIFA